MLLSRTLARRRIARGDRPGFVAAWAPVLLDAAAILVALVAITPLVSDNFTRNEPPPLVVIAIAFAVYFVPSQIVIVLSSLWAAKSRWSDDT